MSSDSPVAVLFDSAGNAIEVVDQHSVKHLATAAIQDVFSSVDNSSITNLGIGGSFTGAFESTLGVAGIQVNVKTDQPVRVSVQQSNDHANWDIVDEYDLAPSTGDGRTTQATSDYYRVVVTNLGPVATSYFRLRTCLCPVVEAVPRALTPHGMLRLSKKTTSFDPDPTNYTDAGETPELELDVANHLKTRGPALTDEGSFRYDFTSGLYTVLTGTCYFRAGLNHVVGVGTSFLTECRIDQYIKLATDPETSYRRVVDIVSNTDLVLDVVYAGTGNGVGHASNWRYTIDAGCAVSVAGSELLLDSGDTNGSIVRALRDGDYLPWTVHFSAKMSQRIANQEGRVGLCDADFGSEQKQALVIFDGVTNTQVKLRTSFHSTDVEETTVTLPDGATTAVSQQYKLDVLFDRVTLTVNGRKLAEHTQHIPGPYDLMDVRISLKNTGVPASSTRLSIDGIYGDNFNSLRVNVGDPVVSEQYPTTQSACTSVAAAAASTELLAANPSRRGFSVYNQSNAILYLKYATGASATSFTVLVPANGYYEDPWRWQGVVYGFWASAAGDARITEFE